MTQAPSVSPPHRGCDRPGYTPLGEPIYRPFFGAGLAVVVTAGAAWGVLLLWKIGMGRSFTGVSVHEVNAHGHAQIMGWVGLFIMGFAYQTLPRLWRTRLPGPALVGAVLAMMLAGIALRASSMVAVDWPGALSVHRAGVILETVAASTFILQLIVAYIRGDRPREPYIGFIAAAGLFFLTQVIYGGWHQSRLMSAPDHDALLTQISTFQAPLRDMQIHGVALLMILGVGSKMFPLMFGLTPTAPRRGWIAAGLLTAAVLLEVAVFLAFQLTGSHVLAAGLLIPWLLLPIGTGLIVIPWRLWRRPAYPAEPEPSGKFIRVAFLWLAVSFAMLLSLPVYRVVSGIAFSHAYYGAIRHAITVGFVSMTIVAMASKVVMLHGGVEPARRPALWLPFVLLNLGCALRVVLQIATDWSDTAFRVVGVSGVLEWTALLIWAAHLAWVMWRPVATPTRLTAA